MIQGMRLKETKNYLTYIPYQILINVSEMPVSVAKCMSISIADWKHKLCDDDILSTKIICYLY
jgi:hypothetical protein